MINANRELSVLDSIWYYHHNAHIMLSVIHYGQYCNLSAQIILNATECIKASINFFVTVNMTLLRCFISISMRTAHIRVDIILTLALTTQQYTKTQPKLGAFDVWFLELEADLDLENGTKQLLWSSSYLLMYFLNIFWDRWNHSKPMSYPFTEISKILCLHFWPQKWRLLIWRI